MQNLNRWVISDVEIYIEINAKKKNYFVGLAYGEDVKIISTKRPFIIDMAR